MYTAVTWLGNKKHNSSDVFTGTIYHSWSNTKKCFVDPGAQRGGAAEFVCEMA